MSKGGLELARSRVSRNGGIFGSDGVPARMEVASVPSVRYGSRGRRRLETRVGVAPEPPATSATKHWSRVEVIVVVEVCIRSASVVEIKHTKRAWDSDLYAVAHRSSNQ